jgi:predicted DsbA family dithiol-disulfide isomerase
MAACRSPESAAAVRSIEVFADVRCPFTHVGLRRFVERRDAAGRDDVRLRVRAWPLELVNGEPLDPVLIDEEVSALRTLVAPDLFAGFRRDSFASSSLPAMSLAAAAYEQGIEVGERVSLALRWAMFEQGRDITDPATLAEIAGESGVARPVEHPSERVVSDWHEGQRRGVVGSPHFFVEGAGFFCPSLDITRDGGHLRIGVDVDGLEAFLTRCFAEGAVDSRSR